MIEAIIFGALVVMVVVYFAFFPRTGAGQRQAWSAAASRLGATLEGSSFHATNIAGRIGGAPFVVRHRKDPVYVFTRTAFAIGVSGPPREVSIATSRSHERQATAIEALVGHLVPPGDEGAASRVRDGLRTLLGYGNIRAGSLGVVVEVRGVIRDAELMLSILNTLAAIAEGCEPLNMEPRALVHALHMSDI